MKKTKLTLVSMAVLLSTSAFANSDVARLNISTKALVPEVITIAFEDGTHKAELISELNGDKWNSKSKQLKITSPVRLTARLASEPKMKGQVQQKSELPYTIELTSTTDTIILDKANSSVELYKGNSVGKETTYMTKIKPIKTSVTPDLYIGNTDIVIQTSI